MLQLDRACSMARQTHAIPLLRNRIAKREQIIIPAPITEMQAHHPTGSVRSRPMRRQMRRTNTSH
jgi:hypothetical protein